MIKNSTFLGGFSELNKEKTNSISSKERILVTKEAAKLLYRGSVEEFKQAKIMASKNLGLERFPSNYEIALEIDKIADEIEGDSRKELITEKRKIALELMSALKKFNPILTGSVWRGTARKGSDIDIIVYASKPSEIIDILESNNYKVNEKRWIKVDFNNQKKSFFNIKLLIDKNEEVEITVRGPEDLGIVEKCEIYGDSRKGLSIVQLKNVLKKDVLKKFIPSSKRTRICIS